MRRLALLLSVCLATAAHAASPRPELLTPRAVAMGGALRALAGPTETARLNPAGLGRERGFFGGAAYANRSADAFDALSITLVDNITSPMGGAIQYLHLQGEVEREDVSLGLSAGQRGLWWGFTARYVHGRDRGSATWEDVFTGDIGLLFERPTGTRIAVVGYDLIDTSIAFLEKRVALGVGQTGLKGWDVGVDVVRNLERDVSSGVDLHLGAEYRPTGSPWALRLGQMWRGDTGKDYASVGFGWSRGGFSVAYGLQKARQRADEFLHVVGVEGSF